MQQQFYSLPLEFDKLIHHKDLLKCPLRQSVIQHLHLILTTAIGEFPVDDQFGCTIWDHEFNNVTSGFKHMELIRQSVLQSILVYEKRLENVRLELLVQQEESIDPARGQLAKKRMDVSITGILQSTNEPFSHEYSFYVGPLSY
jgi:phage baseplate assembly protein W